MTTDLANLLSGGAALLRGQPLYVGTEWYYPAPLAIFYALLALLPFWLAYGLVFAANLTALYAITGRRALVWLAYVPVAFLLLEGQNDLWFLLLERSLTSGRRSALLAALVTLKPQLAVILLPWHLYRWWKTDRRTLVWFAAFVASLWLVPWHQEAWLSQIARSPDRGQSPSLWGLGLPLAITLALVAILLVTSRGRDRWLASLQLSSPVGLLYNCVVLVETAPARWLIPLSWALWVIGSRWAMPALFAGLPLAVVGWQAWVKMKERRQSALSLTLTRPDEPKRAQPDPN